MRQVAEENGLEVLDQLAQHEVGTTRPTLSQTTEQEDQLSRRQVSHLGAKMHIPHTCLTSRRLAQLREAPI